MAPFLSAVIVKLPCAVTVPPVMLIVPEAKEEDADVVVFIIMLLATFNVDVEFVRVTIAPELVERVLFIMSAKQLAVVPAHTITVLAPGMLAAMVASG